MSGAADTTARRAEVLKLARLLEREPEQMGYLEALELKDLRALREQVIEVLWSADNATLTRLAAASKLLPTALTATIAQRAFGPLLAARLAGLIDPERAVDIATRLDTPFLADVATELDPRRTSAVLGLIGPEQVSRVTAELVARQEYVTMGQFVGHLSDEAIEGALGAMDNATLLQVGFVLEDKSRLRRLVGLLPAGRMGAIIDAAAEHGLWLEALDLLGHLTLTQQRTIVTEALALDHAALEEIVAAVIEHELWDQVLIIAERDTTLQAKLTERLPSLPAAQRKRLSAQVRDEGVAARLGVLGEALSGSRASR